MLTSDGGGGDYDDHGADVDADDDVDGHGDGRDALTKHQLVMVVMLMMTMV
jgi:hypothetical protein